MPTVNVNGYELFYADDDFADPWRPHDTIVINHHVFGTHEDTRAWVPTLAREYRVIRLVRRGNGLSEKPPLGYQFTVDDLVSDFLGLLNALGLEKVHMVGNSMGGILSAWFAAKHPERLKSLVLCQAPLWVRGGSPAWQPVSPPRSEGEPPRVASALAMGSWRGQMRFHPVERDPSGDVWDDLKAHYRAAQAAMAPTYVTASLLKMVTTPSTDFTPILPKISTPTLLLTPETNSREDHALMLERIPNCEQVILTGAKYPLYWHAPDRCAQETLKFVRKHS